MGFDAFVSIWVGLFCLFIVLTAIFAISYFSCKDELKKLESRIVTISDKIPNKDTKQAYALQLSDELAKYIRRDKTKNIIYLNIIKDDE